jgi:hypothetical protein
MRELTVLRGRDIELFIGDKPLFGVTSFSAKEKTTYHNVHEFLSSAPVDRVAQGTEYEIKLKIMAMFTAQIPAERAFDLRLSADGEEFTYCGCRVTAVERETQGNKNAESVFILSAESLERQGTDDGQ